eukprot:9462340-Heterocapsa_arctica.AAC.1
MNTVHVKTREVLVDADKVIQLFDPEIIRATREALNRHVLPETADVLVAKYPLKRPEFRAMIALAARITGYEALVITDIRAGERTRAEQLRHSRPVLFTPRFLQLNKRGVGGLRHRRIQRIG